MRQARSKPACFPEQVVVEAGRPLAAPEKRERGTLVRRRQRSADEVRGREASAVEQPSDDTLVARLSGVRRAHESDLRRAQAEALRAVRVEKRHRLDRFRGGPKENLSRRIAAPREQLSVFVDDGSVSPMGGLDERPAIDAGKDRRCVHRSGCIKAPKRHAVGRAIGNLSCRGAEPEHGLSDGHPAARSKPLFQRPESKKPIVFVVGGDNRDAVRQTSENKGVKPLVFRHTRRWLSGLESAFGSSAGSRGKVGEGGIASFPGAPRISSRTPPVRKLG